MTLDAVADEVVNIVAIIGLVLLGLRGGADPTIVVTAIAGLGGYRLRKRPLSPTS